MSLQKDLQNKLIPPFADIEDLGSGGYEFAWSEDRATKWCYVVRPYNNDFVDYWVSTDVLDRFPEMPSDYCRPYLLLGTKL